MKCPCCNEELGYHCDTIKHGEGTELLWVGGHIKGDKESEILGDCQFCSNCGFTQHCDYWLNLNIEEYENDKRRKK
jgi:hypothetical protein